MNIGEVVKTIKKEYPSISISRIRFLEKEGLIKPKRSTGGTRVFTSKDIDRILNILDLQENQYYSLKAIKNNLNLISNKSFKKISIKEYSKHDMLKLTGLSNTDYEQLIKYEFENEQVIFLLEDLERLKAWSYFFNIGLHPRNFTVLKSVSDRMVGFIDHLTSNLHDDDKIIKEDIVVNLSKIFKGQILKNQ
jgi:DNA-binding transcriptional MerR regulator